MGKFVTKEAWLPIIEKQEQSLVFDSFDSSMALDIGLNIIRYAKEKYHLPVAVSIEIDNDVVFSHLMPGTNTVNKMWMARKANVGKITKKSTLHSCLEVEYKGVKLDCLSRPDNHVACGGCWPVAVKGKIPYAYVMVSGLEHYLDHQLIVDAISEYLGEEVEPISV